MIFSAEEVMTVSMVANVCVRGEDGTTDNFLGVNPVVGVRGEENYFSFIDTTRGDAVISIPHDRISSIEYYQPED